MKLLVRIVATFFGTGEAPLVPGTVASFAAAVLYQVFLHKLPAPLFAGLIVLTFAVGVPVAGAHARALGRPDPRPVVIDEACGQWIACFLVPPAIGLTAASFLLFRAFDIVKPFPIRRLERLPGGWGIMADDVLAGLFAGLIVHAYLLVR
jgi:phosphatidylglycerophosphatase A